MFFYDINHLNKTTQHKIIKKWRNFEIFFLKIELSEIYFVSLVGPSNLTRDKGGYYFIAPCNWLNLMGKFIAVYERDLNGSLDLNDQLSLNKGRYSENKVREIIRGRKELSIFLSCT